MKPDYEKLNKSVLILSNNARKIIGMSSITNFIELLLIDLLHEAGHRKVNIIS